MRELNYSDALIPLLDQISEVDGEVYWGNTSNPIAKVYYIPQGTNTKKLVWVKTITLEIPTGSNNLNIANFIDANNPYGAQDITLVVKTGSVVGRLNFYGSINSLYTVTLRIESGAYVQGSGGTYGSNGGNAIVLQRPIILDNQGYIWGGGGNGGRGGDGADGASIKIAGGNHSYGAGSHNLTVDSRITKIYMEVISGSAGGGGGAGGECCSGYGGDWGYSGAGKNSDSGTQNINGRAFKIQVGSGGAGGSAGLGGKATGRDSRPGCGGGNGGRSYIINTGGGVYVDAPATPGGKGGCGRSAPCNSCSGYYIGGGTGGAGGRGGNNGSGLTGGGKSGTAGGAGSAGSAKISWSAKWVPGGVGGAGGTGGRGRGFGQSKGGTDGGDVGTLVNGVRGGTGGTSGAGGNWGLSGGFASSNYTKASDGSSAGLGDGKNNGRSVNGLAISGWNAQNLPGSNLGSTLGGVS